jgi:carbon monoxide dehydrogenase subunit G
MATRIDETLAVHAPIDRAWAILTDLGTLASCVPDAELVSSPEPRSVLARLGPYNATARVANRDDTAHTLRLIGAARASAGPSAALSLTFSLRSKAADTTTVTLDGDIDLVDTTIKSIPAAKIRAFIDRLKVRLEQPLRPSVAIPVSKTPTAVPSLQTTGTMPVYRPPAPPSDDPSKGDKTGDKK